MGVWRKGHGLTIENHVTGKIVQSSADRATKDGWSMSLTSVLSQLAKGT